MSEKIEAHWNDSICTEALSALQYSRANILIESGLDPQAARLFAMLEAERRQALAREIGADAALLARLEWELDSDSDYICYLVQDVPPDNLGARFFWGFFNRKAQA